jgi:hypothetical protein
MPGLRGIPTIYAVRGFPGLNRRRERVCFQIVLE